MKNGFVLIETIVVITVLSVILVLLYGAYSKVIIGVNKKSLYDNTEYIYKANIVRNYLESTLTKSQYERSYYRYCSNIKGTTKCYNETTNDYKNKLFRSIGVEAIYITVWNIDEINKIDLNEFEATTQNFLLSLDYKPISSAFRIIVMFKDENNEEERKKSYQYASIRFGDRG